MVICVMMQCKYDEPFKLILISAWNDSGGAFTHRLFDGHPALYAYPFEMQFGTEQLKDGFSDWFYAKYRWPSFSKSLTSQHAGEIFDAIIDQELKSTLLDLRTSKFRNFKVDVNFEQWRKSFEINFQSMPSTRRAVLIAYINSFFENWLNRAASGQERAFLGHCPVVNVDFDKIHQDFPEIRMLHIVRSPYSGYADMRFRRPEVCVEAYCQKWNLVNSMAVAFEKKYPDNIKCVPYLSLLTKREQTLVQLCQWLKIDFDPLLLEPTWNAKPILGLYPFGGVRIASVEHEYNYKDELKESELDAIKSSTEGIRGLFNI